MCGRPVSAIRDGDWQTSWVHKWCRDRACPACAQQRSRQLAVSIRRAIEQRAGGALFFVTLTRPRVPGEPASAAWRSMQRAWDALRHRPEFHALAGGARILEAPGNRKQGWHVHYHCIIEVHAHSTRPAPCVACSGSRTVARKLGGRWRARVCRSCSSNTHVGDGTMPIGLVELLRAWASLVGGAAAAQCAVPLDDANAGQLAKYITKMWELDDDAARELFAAAENKRLLNTFGAWRSAPRDGDRPARAGLLLRGRRYNIGARRWWLGPLVADIEAMHPRSYVAFEGPARFSMEGEPTAARVGKGSYRPTLVVKRITARAYLRQLADDQRRADQHEPIGDDVPTPGADLIAHASGPRGPWSMYARKLLRLKAPPAPPPEQLPDIKPGDCGKRAWPKWEHEREALGIASDDAAAVALQLRALVDP